MVGDGALVGCFSEAASMSSLVTRPPLPVPGTWAGEIFVSSAIRRTAGEMASWDWVGGGVVFLGSGWGVGVLGEGVGVLAVAGALAVSSIRAMIWPMATSSPALAFREMVPACSAWPSEVILSVSSS